MKYDIRSSEDKNFKIDVKQFGEQHIASDGERIVIAPTEELAVEGVEELQEQNKQASNNSPKPAPLENPRSTGVSWFEGTSWSTKQ